MTAKAGEPKEFAALIGWLVLCFAAAAVGAIASAAAGDFYQRLQRPAWAPPAGLFAPVWSVLYLLMGIATWQVWRARRERAVGPALALFVAQLAANALWTWLFFAWQRGGLAFAEIVVLWFLIGATVFAFWRIRPSAGLLLIPYWAWVTFATALSWSTWQLNPQVLR